MARGITVGIAAESIAHRGAGLGHFLLRALEGLSRQRRDWKFDVVATSSFHELEDVALPNVEVKFWDSRPRDVAMRRVYTLGASLLGRGKYPSFTLRRLSCILPLKYGDMARVWGDGAASDIIWVPNYYIGHEGISPPAILETRDVPTILTIHDIHPAFFPSDWPPHALIRFWRGMVPFARMCDLIITHTEYQRRAIVHHLGIPLANVRVAPIPPLIDSRELLADVGTSRTQALLRKHRICIPFVLYPGSGTYSHKNHVRLLLAWSDLRDRLGSHLPMLVCTTRGHHWDEMRALAEGLHLGGLVRFTDTVPTEDLATLLRACEFVIVPTLYEGGGSGPVADAIVAGKPVVCSKIPPIEEQLRLLGDPGVTFFSPESVPDIGRAVEEALAGISRLTEKSRANQARVLNRIPAIWENWCEIYSSAMEWVVERHHDRRPSSHAH